MAQTTYEVKLSLDGNHSVRVTTDNQAETQLAIAWAKATFERLAGQYSHSDDQGDIETEENNHEEAPICAVHQVPMVRVKGRKGEFWSCHQKNADGSWCSYRPSGE